MEGDLEMCEDKMLVATQKLDKVTISIISFIHIQGVFFSLVPPLKVQTS